MIPILKVRKPGIYSSFQDLGRRGYQKYGIPISGALDRKAFSLGNYIMRNDQNAAALEILLQGLELEVLSQHRLLFTGREINATLDSKPLPMWKTFTVQKGQILKIGGNQESKISYLIPETGFHAPQFLNSSSVFPKGKLGKLLSKDMILYAAGPASTGGERGLIADEIPLYQSEVTVNVWKSAHQHLFTQNAINAFESSEYVLKTGDRMGFFLSGPLLQAEEGHDILSEAVQFGSIQVPKSGQPIILMADAQTIGGYTTIGKAAEEDLWKLAQLPIGGKVRFRFIDQ
ncbi:5-oxoprolinase subunit C family protein [Cytobacillus gottheilii]|uniref:5-oxoprolinase subunit C family protein n=1 Tax=Cytobacillus gottheilii TaxID=859144 RepID=UPI0009B960AC|nr:biotin-dependent carboxyltransferase family protein [Cytobacillus gottheilii]